MKCFPLLPDTNRNYSFSYRRRTSEKRLDKGESFEDVIRTAVSLGGDCDTLTCIAGAMAEAFFGVPDHLKSECRKRIEPDMRKVLDRFETVVSKLL